MSFYAGISPRPLVWPYCTFAEPQYRCLTPSAMHPLSKQRLERPGC